MSHTITTTEGNPAAARALTAADLTREALLARAHALEPDETDAINAGEPVLEIDHSAPGLGWTIYTTVRAGIRTADGRVRPFDIFGNALGRRRFDGRESLPTMRWAARQILPAIVHAGVPVICRDSLHGDVEYAPGRFPAGRTRS